MINVTPCNSKYINCCLSVTHSDYKTLYCHSMNENYLIFLTWISHFVNYWYRKYFLLCCEKKYILSAWFEIGWIRFIRRSVNLQWKTYNKISRRNHSESGTPYLEMPITGHPWKKIPQSPQHSRPPPYSISTFLNNRQYSINQGTKANVKELSRVLCNRVCREDGEGRLVRGAFPRSLQSQLAFM